MPRSSPANNLLVTLQQFVLVVVLATAELFTAAASAAGQLLQYLWFVQTPETGQKTQLLQPGMLSVCLSVLPKKGLYCLQQLLPAIQTQKIFSVLAFPQLVHHCLPILWISHQKLRVNVTFNNGGEFSFSHGKVKRIIYFAFLPYLFLSSSDSHSRSCLLIACSGLTSAFSSVTLLLFRRHPGQGL